MTTTTDQRRAKAGGEIGANGEWYEGGKFIATQEDTIKTALMRHEITPEELARRAAAQAEHDATVARLNAWIAARAEQFAPVLAVLEARLNDQWGNPVVIPETFHQSLGRQLRASGSVSPEQAQYVAKAVYGRQNKHNSEQYDVFLTALVEEFA